MTTNKFKVEDKVRVRTDLESDTNYGGIRFNTDMRRFKGKVMTIGKLTIGARYDSYKLNESVYNWTDEMLEPAEEREFKAGDKVKRLYTGPYGITKGDIYTVKEIYGGWVSIEEISAPNSPHPFCKRGFDLVTPIEESEFKVGDRVIKHQRYSDGLYCKYSGEESEVPIGTQGTIKQILPTDNGERIIVRFDSIRYNWNVDKSEIILDTMKDETERVIEIQKEMEEVIEMEKPNTAIEKKACGLARQEVIKKRTEEKQREYERNMTSFISYETSARDYKKRADELKEKLGVTDADMKELF